MTSAVLPPNQIDISPARDGADRAAALKLLADYADWLRFARGGEDVEATRDLQRDPGLLGSRYVTPNGALVLARLAGHAVGFATVRRLGCDAAELSRIYLRPSARGLGLAPPLLEAAIDAARRLFITRVLVELRPEVMPAAARLFSKRGFAPVEPGAAPGFMTWELDPIDGSRCASAICCVGESN